MKKDKYVELVEKLDSYLAVSGRQVSPTLHSSGDGNAPDTLFITPNMDVEQLTKSELTYAHVLLHKMYSSGGNKSLTKTDIERLHKDVSKKINHQQFDKLDRV